MQFVSLEFIVFVTVLIVAYYCVPKKIQWIVLLTGSLFFYAFAGWRSMLFIVLSATNSYFIAKTLSYMAQRENAFVDLHREEWSKEERKSYRAHSKKNRFAVLVVGLVIGFGLLCIPKYTAFTVSNVNAITGLSISIPSILLPMGLSFYTFQSMGYLIDCYREKVQCEKNFAKYALFVCYFPQLVQGPISRFNDLEPQLMAEHRASWDVICRGLIRVLWGYFKKLVVADTALKAVSTIIGDATRYDGIYVFLLILLYSIEIYGDFTGGIDITLGLSEMLGIYVKENFDHPFSSTSTKEYWRRWHITMGTWFSDYIFYPLSVCKPMQKLSKWSRSHLGNAIGKRLPVYLATIVTWYATGLWHGAGWNFIVWGLLNCLVILVSQELSPLYDRFHHRFPKLKDNFFYRHFMMIRTFLLMGLIRTLDCYRNVGTTFKQWGTMFSHLGLSRLISKEALLGLNLPEWVLLFVGVVTIWQVSRHSPNENPLRAKIVAKTSWTMIVCGVLLCIILVFGAWGTGYDASQFIYKQF